MHACLLQIYNHDPPLFIQLWFILDNQLWSCAALLFRIKIDLSSCLRHAFGYILFTCFKAPEWYSDCRQIACCSYMSFDWLWGRKYGTVWYHLACSGFYLTVFILCQFQRKLTGTLRIQPRVLSQLCSACCVFGVTCWFYVNRFQELSAILSPLGLYGGNQKSKIPLLAN
jgi:hypothetical protein